MSRWKELAGLPFFCRLPRLSGVPGLSRLARLNYLSAMSRLSWRGLHAGIGGSGQCRVALSGAVLFRLDGLTRLDGLRNHLLIRGRHGRIGFTALIGLPCSITTITLLILLLRWDRGGVAALIRRSRCVREDGCPARRLCECR